MELPPAYCLIIPEPVRDKLNLKAGDWIAFEETDDQIIFKKFAPSHLNDEDFKNQFPYLNMASDWLGIYEAKDGSTSYTSKMVEYSSEDEDEN